MDVDQYFELLSKNFEEAYDIATEARARGFDPEKFVEIKPAPDLASRVETIIGIDGLAEIMKEKSDGKTRQELAFEMVKDMCSDEKFSKSQEKRLTIATRVGLAILTEGIVVAPTEGVQGVEIHKNPDGSDYVSVIYAGPIRGAGGTSMALSAALADYGRRLLGIGSYRAQQTEIERYLEEIQLYNSKGARLQYYPSESDIRMVLENCPVCIDGLPTEEVEVSVHRNIKRLDSTGKEQALTNRVRGGVCLVLCEGIAQKAKSVLKETKNVGLDWSWLNNIIKVDKVSQKDSTKDKKDSVFLQELVAGRPILAYPDHSGAFRLRYGRSRLTGIAAKGFSPATMIILDGFIATGTQLKIDKPGKGCIATPVDSVEGPFVKLDNGEALRINSAEQAKELKDRVTKIIAVGDILITYGDFKKTNTPLQPTSYVEEYWFEQLKSKGYNKEMPEINNFKDAFELSEKYGVPMHPKYIFEYSEISGKELFEIFSALVNSKIEKSGKSLFDVTAVVITDKETIKNIVGQLEKLCVPHTETGASIIIKMDDAQSLLASFGMLNGTELSIRGGESLDAEKESLEIINSLAPFKIMRRSTRIGARIGRPEKAKERLMKPAPNVLFPIGGYMSRERNIYKTYSNEKRRFGNPGIEVELARYRCELGQEITETAYCKNHGSGAKLERICKSCGRKSNSEICTYCGGTAVATETRKIDIIGVVDGALQDLGVSTLPKTLKGVKGLTNRDKIAEPIQKGILRAMYGVYTFKDGTTRFDATDTPMTHFYPNEIMVGVERLKGLGYAEDYSGNELKVENQLLELKHQDVIINKHCAEYLINVAAFVDDLLVKFYKLEPFYNVKKIEDLLGHFVITLSPHTSAGVLCRIIGFTEASVGFAHPYVISARRRNCDGDEDTTMLLLDALINFSRSYLPTTIGGTMDAPLILTVKVEPHEVDDEVHDMEVSEAYGLDFYEKTFQYPSPNELKVELVRSRLKSKGAFKDLRFTHLSGDSAVTTAPRRSSYTKLKTMQEKVDSQFRLMDKMYSVNRADTAKRLILSHFIPDLIGNMHSFSKQNFRCVSCNSKYRRVPLVGKCTRCGGKLVLTISKGSIEKYLNMAIELSNRYNLEPYIKQRLVLIREEIENVFGGIGGGEIPTKQFNLSRFL